jgi:aspartate aminotransferase
MNAAKLTTLAQAIDSVVRQGIREAEEAERERVALEAALAAAREAAAREEAEAAAARAAAAAEAAREQDKLLMEQKILDALEAQRRSEEEEKRKEDEQRKFEEAVRKAAERAEISKKANAILATIGLGMGLGED